MVRKRKNLGWAEKEGERESERKSLEEPFDGYIVATVLQSVKEQMNDMRIGAQ